MEYVELDRGNAIRQMAKELVLVAHGMDILNVVQRIGMINVKVLMLQHMERIFV